MLERLESLHENNRLEAKAAQSGLPRSLWETYSAFANTSGGSILLGVEEWADKSLHVIGVPDPQKLLDDFWNTVNNAQKVSENVLSDNDVAVLDIDDAPVIEIRVPRANRRVKPVFLNDNPKRSFRRNHSGDYLCRYEEVQSMMRDAAEESHDAKPLANVRMDELDAMTVRSYRRLYANLHRGHPWNQLSDDEFLRCVGAASVAEDGELHPTGAGLLMLGHDWRIVEEFPNYFLDYRQQLSSRERWQDRVVSQSGDWSGNVFDFFYRAYNLMKQALKTPFKLAETERVDDTPAHRALREALANCLTNANYHERRGIVCLWEPDALTIANPGDFRVDIGAALRGGESDPRNATMMRMFALVNIGERAGSGLPKIVSGWTECGYIAPRYEESFGPDRTTLTLPLAFENDFGETGHLSAKQDGSFSETGYQDTKQDGETGHLSAKQDGEREKTGFCDEKQAFEPQKTGLWDAKQDGESDEAGYRNAKRDFSLRLEDFDLNDRTRENIQSLFDEFGLLGVFSRKDVAEVTGLTVSPAAELMRKMKTLGLIKPAPEKGWSKYRFSI